MVTITLTENQISQLSTTSRSEVTMTLTREQFKAIKKRYPELSSNRITITVPVDIRGSQLAAPYIPGGAVVAAAVSSTGQLKGSLSG